MSNDATGREPGDTVNLSTLIAPHLPFLRRYGRALCGDQTSGDRMVAATLEALIADRSAIDLTHPPRVALYRLFQDLLSTRGIAGGDAGGAAPVAAPLSTMTPRSRQYLLLTTLEEFSPDQAAVVMNIAPDEARILAQGAQAALGNQSSARVMIIEDEPIIALDIESIVVGMGHDVVGIADTRTSAVALAAETRPDLVLADIQLADGSSGIDAVSDILGQMQVPVIFVTAYPERLLTGERPEPIFLITKPFRPQMIEACIAQVLFHHEPA